MKCKAMVQFSRPRRREVAVVIFAALLLAPIGCSKAEINEAIDDAKAKTQSLTESAVAKVEESLPATGNVSLALTPPVEMDRAEVEVIVIGDGRPNVVQIANYDTTMGNRPFTAVLFSGTTTAANSRDLAGQSVDCDMYFQQSASSPLAISKPGESVTVVFDSVNEEDNTITATLQATELITSDNRPLRVGGGKITAVVLDQGQ
jgi:hypothetical protein